MSIRLNVPLESEEAKALMRWVKLKRIPCEPYFIHIPNGEYRPLKTAASLKAQGVKKGVPDFMYFYPSGEYKGMAIELKRVHGGTLNNDQKRWIKHLREIGWYALRCDGWQEASKEIEDYLEKKL